MCSFRQIDFGTENADIWQIAVQFLIVQPVTDDEMIRDAKATIDDRKIHQAASWPVQQRADIQTGGLALTQPAQQKMQRETRVYDILDDQDMTALS